jgi:hypothetical protein
MDTRPGYSPEGWSPMVNVLTKRWKDPPCYQCENPLFRLGQGFKFANCWHNQRVLHLGFSINSSSIHHVSAPVRILVIADTFWKASYYTFWAIGSLVTLARVQSYPQWSWHEFQGNTAYSIYLSLSFFSILLVLLCMYIYIVVFTVCWTILKHIINNYS